MVINAVAVTTASIGSPASLKIKPLTGTIYSMVKKVVNPAVNSVLMLVLCCLSLKYPNVYPIFCQKIDEVFIFYALISFKTP